MSVPSPEPPTARARDVVERIDAVRFTPVRLRQGYAMPQLDDLLAEVRRAAGSGERIRPLIDAARLDRVRLREGYAIEEVDAFLAGLVATLP